MTTEDRFLSQLNGGKPVTLADVRRLGRYASHFADDGRLWEYDQRRFWSTNLLRDSPERQPIGDEGGLPVWPWHHHPMCDCEVCGSDAER